MPATTGQAGTDDRHDIRPVGMDANLSGIGLIFWDGWYSSLAQKTSPMKRRQGAGQQVFCRDAGTPAVLQSTWPE
jgi:hypothetical protein